MCSQPCIGSPVAATLGRLAITTNMRMIWTTRGMLRSVSMNTLEIRLTIQLLDSRPTPTSTPSTVATRIPPMGEPERVDHTHPQGPATGVGVGVDARTHLAARVDAEESVARVDVPGLEVVASLRRQEVHGEEHQQQRQHLGQPLDDGGVAVERRTLGLRRGERGFFGVGHAGGASGAVICARNGNGGPGLYPGPRKPRRVIRPDSAFGGSAC